MGTLIEIIKENIEHRNQMWELAKIHQKKQYKGSDGGRMWAVAKPMMYIVVFYFAISIGFKGSKGIPGIICPYFVWLAIGMIAFFYMRDMITNGATCFKKYPMLVSNAKYPISTLPTTVSVSYLLLHFVMLAIGIAICFLFGNWPSIYWIQIPFYMALMFIMCVFWSIFSGLISTIFRDFYHFLQVINQAIFWLSGILFDINGLSPAMQKVFMFNPFTYIVEGYRNALCRHVWFFEEPLKLGCFLIILLVLIALSMILYKKLIRRIPDVL